MLTNRYAIIETLDGKDINPSPILFTDRLYNAWLAVHCLNLVCDGSFFQYDFKKLDPVRHPDFDYFDGAVRDVSCMAELYAQDIH